MSTNWNREYRLSFGPSGGSGYEIGETSPSQPQGLHIRFDVQRAEMQSENESKISVWNLSPQSIAILNEPDCGIVLKAGYEGDIGEIFVGIVTSVITDLDATAADRETKITACDGRIELRDTYVSQSFGKGTENKKVIQDAVDQMGIPIVFSDDAEFVELEQGFSFIGPAKETLNKACAQSGLTWAVQNGIVHVKKERGTINQSAFVLSADTGLIGYPKQKTIGAQNDESEGQNGYEVNFLLNHNVNIDDLVNLQSKVAQGFFRVHSLRISGDSEGEADWICTAELLEV